MFAKTASGLVEVVSVSSAELARLPYDLAEGVYMVGTGSTGAAAALGVSGEPFFVFSPLVHAYFIRVLCRGSPNARIHVRVWSDV